MSELTKAGLVNADNWLRTMTDGGYCETSDANKVIRYLKDRLEKAEDELRKLKLANYMDASLAMNQGYEELPPQKEKAE